MAGLQEIHQSQLSEAKEQIEHSLSTTFKPSAKLLDTRHMFEQLVKQKKYTEAHGLKSEIAKLEKAEQQKHMDTRDVKIAKALEKVVAKQVIEVNSLKKKLDSQLHEQTRLREIESGQ